jgi:enterochelin esterase-like enzyme
VPYTLERLTMASPGAAGREVTVFVPENTGKKGAPLPLLLLHDGQNLFDPDRAYVRGQHWRVAETASELIDAGRLPPLVIAGIDHAGDERAFDMTPTRGNQPSGGGVALYGRFLMDDVVPRLAKEFNVRADADGLAMGGSSLGGLATLAIALQFPGRIGRLLLMSPSVWWDDRVILRRLRRTRLQPRPRVWLDIGRREGGRTVADARALRDALVPQTRALHYFEDPNGRHTEADWARRLGDALTWTFEIDR